MNATLAASPDVDYVIILEGVNDLAFDRLENGSDEGAQAEILANLRGMIQVVLGMGRIPVIGTLTPICCNQEFRIDPADVASLNDGIRNLASEFQIDLIDFFEGFGGVSYDPASGQLHSSEGLHPTPFGYDVMSELAADVLG